MSAPGTVVQAGTAQQEPSGQKLAVWWKLCSHAGFGCCGEADQGNGLASRALQTRVPLRPEGREAHPRAGRVAQETLSGGRGRGWWLLYEFGRSNKTVRYQTEDFPCNALIPAAIFRFTMSDLVVDNKVDNELIFLLNKDKTTVHKPFSILMYQVGYQIKLTSSGNSPTTWSLSCALLFYVYGRNYFQVAINSKLILSLIWINCRLYIKNGNFVQHIFLKCLMHGYEIALLRENYCKEQRSSCAKNCLLRFKGEMPQHPWDSSKFHSHHLNS